VAGHAVLPAARGEARWVPPRAGRMAPSPSISYRGGWVFWILQLIDELDGRSGSEPPSRKDMRELMETTLTQMDEAKEWNITLTYALS
jgi:hypothetical protein